MIYFTLYIDGKNRAQYNSPSFAGGIAQLGERLHGMQEVSGSIPLTSTSLWQYHKLTAKRLSSISKSSGPHRLEA